MFVMILKPQGFTLSRVIKLLKLVLLKLKMAESLGYSGAMVGRGLMGRPWALAQIMGQTPPSNIGQVVLKHLDYALEYYGDKTAVPMFRKHAAWYSAGMKNSSEFRIKVNQISDGNLLKVAIQDFWGII